MCVVLHRFHVAMLTVRTAIKPATSSWGLSRWFKREGSPAPGSVKANMGEESTFVFDPELKRWVNKKVHLLRFHGDRRRDVRRLAHRPKLHPVLHPLHRELRPSLPSLRCAPSVLLASSLRHRHLYRPVVHPSLPLRPLRLRLLRLRSLLHQRSARSQRRRRRAAGDMVRLLLALRGIAHTSHSRCHVVKSFSVALCCKPACTREPHVSPFL